LNTADFDYTLPPGLIATHPAERRDASRLLVMDRRGGGLRHQRFSDLPGELRPGDCLVLNDSRVIPARLLGERRSGGRAEMLLISPDTDGLWNARVKPAKKLRVGDRIRLIPARAGISGGEADATPDSSGAWAEIREAREDGFRRIAFDSPLGDEALLERYGRMPLPPYILAARKAAQSVTRSGPETASEAAEVEDRERYQTVYADAPGSVAAPTAGLHFTPELLAKIGDAGVEIQRITLHVGPGTFAPVKTESIEAHRMHEEVFEIGAGAAEAIEAARQDRGRRVIAVGTTVTRTLESCFAQHGRIVETQRATRLMIAPGFEFGAIDGLITNFHLPRSTLLMLVSAFAGREAVLAAYAEAVRRQYRFYSYGDAMLIATCVAESALEV
jgi:S-adenosylmethionine:tRNA ribosyltransferase-isomerase